MTDTERQSIQAQIHDMDARNMRQFDILHERLEKSHTALAGTISKLMGEQKERLSNHIKKYEIEQREVREKIEKLATVDALKSVEKVSNKALKSVEKVSNNALKWRERVVWIGLGLALGLTPSFPQLEPLLSIFL